MGHGLPERREIALAVDIQLEDGRLDEGEVPSHSPGSWQCLICVLMWKQASRLTAGRDQREALKHPGSRGTLETV